MAIKNPIDIAPRLTVSTWDFTNKRNITTTGYQYFIEDWDGASLDGSLELYWITTGFSTPPVNGDCIRVAINERSPLTAPIGYHYYVIQTVDKINFGRFYKIMARPRFMDFIGEQISQRAYSSTTTIKAVLQDMVTDTGCPDPVDSNLMTSIVSNSYYNIVGQDMMEAISNLSELYKWVFLWGAFVDPNTISDQGWGLYKTTNGRNAVTLTQNQQIIGDITKKDDTSQILNKVHVIYGGGDTEVIVQDTTSQTAYGICEDSFYYPEINNATDATAAGQGLIDKFKNAIPRYKCKIFKVNGALDGNTDGCYRYNPISYGLDETGYGNYAFARQFNLVGVCPAVTYSAQIMLSWHFDSRKPYYEATFGLPATTLTAAISEVASRVTAIEKGFNQAVTTTSAVKFATVNATSAIQIGGVEVIGSGRIANLVSLKIGGTEVISSSRNIYNVGILTLNNYVTCGATRGQVRTDSTYGVTLCSIDGASWKDLRANGYYIQDTQIIDSSRIATLYNVYTGGINFNANLWPSTGLISGDGFITRNADSGSIYVMMGGGANTRAFTIFGQNISNPIFNINSTNATNANNYVDVFGTFRIWDSTSVYHNDMTVDTSSRLNLSGGLKVSSYLMCAYTTASNTDQMVNTAQASSTATTYTKVKTIKVNTFLQNFRVYWEMLASAGNTSYYKIYKNGVAIGTEVTYANSSTWGSSYQDFNDLQPGDTIELWVKTTALSVYYANLKIRFDVTTPTALYTTS